MIIGIIPSDHIRGKACMVNFVSGVAEFDTLIEFGNISLEHSITPAIFHEVLWQDSFTTNEYIREISQGDNTACWKYIANAKEIQFLSYDFDNGVASKDIHKLAWDYNHVVLASTNHLVDKQDGKGVQERFHLFIKLDKPITDPIMYRFICKHFADNILKCPKKSDSSVMEMSRYFYKHKEILYVNDNRKDLVTGIYGFEYRKYEAIRRLELLSHKAIKINHDPTKLIYWKRNIANDLRTEGKRHKSIFTACLYLKGFGIDENKAMDIIKSTTTLTDNREIERSIINAYSKI
jgi:hypothetical protein